MVHASISQLLHPNPIRRLIQLQFYYPKLQFSLNERYRTEWDYLSAHHLPFSPPGATPGFITEQETAPFFFVLANNYIPPTLHKPHRKG
jgi:hypothetical protein